MRAVGSRWSQLLTCAAMLAACYILCVSTALSRSLEPKQPRLSSPSPPPLPPPPPPPPPPLPTEAPPPTAVLPRLLSAGRPAKASVRGNSCACQCRHQRIDQGLVEGSMAGCGRHERHAHIGRALGVSRPRWPSSRGIICFGLGDGVCRRLRRTGPSGRHVGDASHDARRADQVHAACCRHAERARWSACARSAPVSGAHPTPRDALGRVALEV